MLVVNLLSQCDQLTTITSFGCRTLVTKSNPQNSELDSQLQDRQPRNTAESYALFATWSWMLHQQEIRCPDTYLLWDVTRGEGGITQTGSGNIADLTNNAGTALDGGGSGLDLECWNCWVTFVRLSGCDHHAKVSIVAYLG